jgi:serine/threonine protein kinase
MLPESEIDQFAHADLERPAYMHSANILHRDLKPPTAAECNRDLKICDFGLARGSQTAVPRDPITLSMS